LQNLPGKYSTLNDLSLNLYNFVRNRFDEVLEASYSELEPCILVNYLFTLRYGSFTLAFILSKHLSSFSNIISQAFKHLQVKDQPTDVASQRLMMFGAAKNVLGAGMRILGVEPLLKM
jgi:arginyl-tRNA synthetase